MPTVAELQEKYNEISKIRRAAKTDYSMSNTKKCQIAEEYTAMGNEL